MEIRIRYRRYRVLFESVWGRLPAGDCREIEKDLVFVTDKMADFKGGQRRANVYGMVARTRGGLKLLLRHKFLLTLDDRFVLGVIAHELAHVLCRHPLDGVLWTRTPKEAYLWAEAEANALAQAWGFAPPSIITGHWATSEHYPLIARLGPNFAPATVKLAPARLAERKAVAPAAAARPVQAHFAFPERTTRVA